MFSWAKSARSYLHRFAQKQNISTNERTRYFVENYPIWSNFQICSSNWRWKSNDQWYLSDCNGSIIRGCDYPLFPSFLGDVIIILQYNQPISGNNQPIFPTVCHITPPYLKQKRVRKSLLDMIGWSYSIIFPIQIAIWRYTLWLCQNSYWKWP